MNWFLGLGAVGVIVLLFSYVLDGVLDGLLDLGLDGWLSLPAIAGFVSMLGFVGAIAYGGIGLGTAASVGIGAAAGVGAAWFAGRLSRALMRGQTDSTLTGDALVGAAGRVVTPIAAEGYGEVLLSVHGQPLKYAARSRSGPLTLGTEVWVTASLTTTSVEVAEVRSISS
ncbi:hypothetical protein [Streptomyces sp. NBC_01304]|uniref:hypothetical protein n=1 Tax=Streptomyces sp. NBC_01304 TaxID=2903818 RepID=UPI002E14CD82|nr:hypothetical protein OG430_46020 [Streptomyces sp. NBC_01304]